MTPSDNGSWALVQGRILLSTVPAQLTVSGCAPAFSWPNGVVSPVPVS